MPSFARRPFIDDSKLVAADKGVSSFLSSISGLIVQEVNLLASVQEPVEHLERDFQLIRDLLPSIWGRSGFDERADGWLEECSTVANDAEGLISRYQKMFSERRATKRLIHLAERHELAQELERVTLKIRHFLELGKLILSERRQEARGKISGSAMGKLDTFIYSRNWLHPAKILKRVSSLRYELAPLHNFLNELEPAAKLDERQKVWVKEAKDIFQFVEETFSAFLHSAEEATRRFECFAPVKNAITAWGSRSKLRKILQKIEKRILVASSRYYTYAIGEFKVSNGSRSIIPQVRMEGVATGSKSTYVGPFFLFTFWSRATTQPVDQLFSRLVWQLDLSLMQALVEDVKQMRDSDRIVNVWLQQMVEICPRMEDLDNNFTVKSERRKGIRRLLSLNKIAHKAKQIEKDIEDIFARMMRYDIGSFIAEYGKLEVPAFTEIGSQQSILFGKSKAQARVKNELQIINALLEEVRTMEKLDEKVKVWAEEIAGVAHEAKEIAEQEFKGISGRIKLAKRTHRLSKWIDQIMEWKRTYNIRGIRAGNTSSVTGRVLEPAKPYPSGIVAVESIRREIKLMKALVADMQENSGIYKKRDVWKVEMLEFADAEKLVENHDKIWRSNMPKLWKLFILYKDFGTRHIMDYITCLHERIKEISRIPAVVDDEIPARLNVDDEIPARLNVDDEIPARLNVYDETPSRLNVDDEIPARLNLQNKYLCVVPILGPTGMTSVSELICKNNVILEHFDCCVQVRIPEDFNALRVLEDIVEQVEEREEKKTVTEPLVASARTSQTEICTDEEDMMEKLRKVLIQRRYLIVLDDFLSAEVWLDLQKAFPDASNGSRIILATQSMDEENWQQLCKKLASEMNSDQSRNLTRQGGYQILDPVKIKEHSRERETVPHYLWRFLHYFLLFPAAMEIPARRLIALWVAEGLALAKSDTTAEYTGELLVLELIDRNMIKATKWKPNGKVKACQLSEGILETLLKKTEAANFFKDEANKNFRLVVDHTNRNDICGHIDGSKPCPSSLLKACYREVNCFFSFNTEEGGKHGDNVGNFLRRCISKRCFLSLRVLDLERVFRPKLPTVLGKLTGMRYLGLRWTYLESLPPEVSKLLNLRVLDVKHTYISTLPQSIWSMQYLRHLYLSETYRTRFVSPTKKPSLTELQTLWGAFVDEDSPVSGGLNTILNIRKLGLTCSRSMSSPDLMESQLVAVAEWISKLKNLEYLRLKSYDHDGNPSDLHLKLLSGHTNLSTIYLLGRLKDPSVAFKLPETVIDLTLSGSQLENDPMKALQWMPNLTILRLFSGSTKCRSLWCSKQGFPRLQVLKIWKLEHLDCLGIEDGSLATLEDLEIRDCSNFKMFPYGLEHVKKLKKLKLYGMPDELIQSAMIYESIVWDTVEPNEFGTVFSRSTKALGA